MQHMTIAYSPSPHSLSRFDDDPFQMREEEEKKETKFNEISFSENNNKKFVSEMVWKRSPNRNINEFNPYVTFQFNQLLNRCLFFNFVYFGGSNISLEVIWILICVYVNPIRSKIYDICCYNLLSILLALLRISFSFFKL